MSDTAKPRSALRWLIFVPPAIFGVILGLFLFGMYRDDPEGLPSTMVGRLPPEMQLSPLAGAPLTTAEVLAAPELKLVNFWASWCAPCRVEHPFLSEIAATGIKVHGINYKDQPANAEGFLAELGNPYATMGADSVGRTAINWGVYGVPETYLIDAEGKILLRHAGPITRQEYERVILPALERARGQ